MVGRRATALLLVFGLLLGAAACGNSRAVEVDFDKRDGVPEVKVVGADTSPFAPGTLSIAVTGLLTPTETLAGYGGLVAYLEEGLGRPVKLVQRGTYAELNALMQVGQLDAALVCPLPYVQGHRAFGMELVAAPVHRGEPEHYSYLIVPSDSDASGLGDLRDGVFAFTDPDSSSGWLIPAYQLALTGETPDTFFARYIFTYHHSESFRAVARDLARRLTVPQGILTWIASGVPGPPGSRS